MQSRRSVGSMRSVVFYRCQMFSGFILFLCIGLAVIGIYTVSPSHLALPLSLMLVIIGIVISAGQLITAAMTFSSVISPLEAMFESIRGWMGEVESNNIEAITIEKIRATMGGLASLSGRYSEKWPKEVEMLQAAFIHTLKLMESAWQKAEADAIMVGLGGVCSQVAHDMRSPATVIQTMSRAVLDVNTEAERRELSGLMGQSAKRLHGMADELLSYRKAGAVELKPMDLSNVVRDVCREMQVMAQSKNVQLELDIPTDQDFIGDADQLGRVMQNLVSNAIQAVEKQGDGQVSVRMVREDGLIRLNIRDNGPGFPAGHVDKMFKTGFTTKGKQGNGLGLIYCANVVKGHGGQINARNHSDGGAEIAITLPYEVVQ